MLDVRANFASSTHSARRGGAERRVIRPSRRRVARSWAGCLDRLSRRALECV